MPNDRIAHAWADRLRRDGFAILAAHRPDVFIEALKRDLATPFAAAPFGDGAFYGDRTKRFGRLLQRSPYIADLALDPLILAIAKEVLDSEQPQLNLSQAIAIHPGSRVQPPHRDQDMWQFAKSPETTCMINVMWALDPFTAQNGATRIWPRSNHADWSTMLSESAAIDAIAPAGSAILFLGQTLHAGGANRSTSVRRGLILSYCQNWLLPDENPWLAYPPTIARTFSCDLRRLVGYEQRFAGLNNFEGQHPTVLLDDTVPDFLRFTDAMSPDQMAQIDAYYASISEPSVSSAAATIA